MNLLQCGIPSRTLAIFCTMLVAPGDIFLYAQPGSAQNPGGNSERSLTPEQLNSLVAPIALYPDPLLAQILAASTYPLQITEASRWRLAHSNLTGKKLIEGAEKQDWDPSIQALVVFPSVLQQMDQNLSWTTSLGNAFLAQQDQLMAAIQQMRQQAYQAGNIKSNSRQTVEVQTVEGQPVITIQPANPQMIYVPGYNPTEVYGPPAAYYPYPAMAYPPPPTGSTVAAGAISFGAGVALGAVFSGCCGNSGWGWGLNWGRGSTVVVNNNFFGRYGFATPYATGASGRAVWVHNPRHRGAVPYSNRAVAGRYGSAAGVRGPYGSAGAVATPYRGAAGVKTPNVAAGAITTPNGGAAGVRTPSGTAAAVRTPNGSAIKTPGGTFGSASRAAPSTGAASRSFNSGASRSSVFSGANGSGARARSSSDRGFSSMGGARQGGGRRGRR
jgi:hypothetical protein